VQKRGEGAKGKAIVSSRKTRGGGRGSVEKKMHARSHPHGVQERKGEKVDRKSPQNKPPGKNSWPGGTEARKIKKSEYRTEGKHVRLEGTVESRETKGDTAAESERFTSPCVGKKDGRDRKL